MKLYTEISLENFEAWSGAVSTLDRIIAEDKCDELEAILEEQYPDGMSDTELNDLLWFEEETIFEWLGIRTESEIRQELQEATEDMEELLENFEDEVAEMVEFNNETRKTEGLAEMDAEEINSLKAEIFANNYADDSEEITSRIAELEEELENI